MVGVGKGYPILTSLKVSKIYKLFISTKEYKEREEKKKEIQTLEANAVELTVIKFTKTELC